VGLDKPPAKDMRKRGRKPKNANGDSTSKIDKSGTNITAKRSRKLAERSTARLGQVTTAKAGKAANASKLKGTTAEAKFNAPNSDKVWSGRGRRPLWMTSDAAQYAIDGSVAITSSPRLLKWILYSGK
jgi:DNA-binding protein H-NS